MHMTQTLPYIDLHCRILPYIAAYCPTLPYIALYYLFCLFLYSNTSNSLSAGLCRIVPGSVISTGRLGHFGYFMGAAKVLVISKPMMIFHAGHRKS